MKRARTAAGKCLSHVVSSLSASTIALPDSYVVAAPLHTGDNFRDQSKVGANTWIGDRAGDMRRVLDHLLGTWPGRSSLDPSKIGIFGFSAGGTTALVNVGGDLDPKRLSRHCVQRPEFACTLLKNAALDNDIAASGSAHDTRIRAAVIAAPGFGFAFSPDSLALLDVPLQLWAGAADENVPPASNADALRDLLTQPPEYHLVEGATHFSFLAPCGPTKLLLPKMLCADAAGFDRAAFHTKFNNEVVRFFDSRLGRIKKGNLKDGSLEE